MAALGSLRPRWAQGAQRTAPTGTTELTIQQAEVWIDGRRSATMTVGGSIPGPLVRLQEGAETTMIVHNQLSEDSSIHWHGLLVPTEMDGVPGVSFAGIPPGERFTYRFPVRQSGTYWYHSHSGLQEQSGVYGPLIIDPAEPQQHSYDREHVVMLTDWTFMNPHRVMARLKKSGGSFNYQKRTLGDFLSERDGMSRTQALQWSRVRMDPTDFSDVTGAAYTYLLNGSSPMENWTGLFKPGERIRLRFINGSAMSYFDVRIPGLSMTVIASDGQDVQPVTVGEFRIAVAETFDVIVQPTAAQAYTIFAETIDRSGYARGTLAPRHGMSAAIPPPRPRPLRTMADMGMGASDMAGMSGMEAAPAASMGADMQSMTETSAPARHSDDHHGPGNTMTAMMPTSRLDEPGAGLGADGWRVLTYADLRAVTPGLDRRPPQRELELHLTGNMERYMWSFDGLKFSEVDGPIPFYHGERLRLILVNDTMMDHPIHLHGMWMELENGHGDHIPRKHTISIKPGERVSALISADAPGDWAFHCHLLYHMDMGMFRVVSVIRDGQSEAR